MSRSPLLAPLLEALALVPRWQSAVAWAALVVTAAVMRATVLASATVPFSGLAGLAPGLALVLILGAMTFFLARSFVAPHAGHARPCYLQATGLYIVMCIAEWFVSLLGTVIVFASNPSSFMMTYGSVLVGSLGKVVVFPIMVAAVTASAGADRPRLGETMTFVVTKGAFAYLWYIVCAAAFSSLMVFAFLNLLGPASQANALTGNIVQSAITGTGDLLQLLLALIVARWAIPDGERQAEVFD